MIKPVFTEKSLKAAKEGKYTFWVSRSAVKDGIKAEVNKVFDVHVISIKTVTVPGENKKNQRGKKVTVIGRKKAIVTLKEKEKISIFEEKK